jgi:hypothetical protein
MVTAASVSRESSPRTAETCGQQPVRGRETRAQQAPGSPQARPSLFDNLLTDRLVGASCCHVSACDAKSAAAPSGPRNLVKYSRRVVRAAPRGPCCGRRPAHARGRAKLKTFAREVWDPYAATVYSTLPGNKLRQSRRGASEQKSTILAICAHSRPGGQNGRSILRLTTSVPDDDAN